uniref:Uncharacterized protein n=1 Tax=Desertifilum tharense IPPAS B-1220 TaxID=1781255 RepID=A0ACD5GMQ2_9CYAN
MLFITLTPPNRKIPTPVSLPTSPSPHPLLTRNSELGTRYSLPHSALSTFNSALFSPTLFPTQHSALSTQH